MNIMQLFPQFMQQMRGQDPNAILQQMLTSGQVSQQQLDQAQQAAGKIGEQLNSFKSMFGFK